MKRIAADLGVSVTTISKVLNKHADIGPAMRARVLQRVEELGRGSGKTKKAAEQSAAERALERLEEHGR